jgi:hypothetical protein
MVRVDKPLEQLAGITHVGTRIAVLLIRNKEAVV